MFDRCALRTSGQRSLRTERAGVSRRAVARVPARARRTSLQASLPGAVVAITERVGRRQRGPGRGATRRTRRTTNATGRRSRCRSLSRGFRRSLGRAGLDGEGHRVGDDLATNTTDGAVVTRLQRVLPVGVDDHIAWRDQDVVDVRGCEVGDRDGTTALDAERRDAELDRRRRIGRSLGRRVGRSLGRRVGRSLGRRVGRSLGRRVGRRVRGGSVGGSVGASVGSGMLQPLL